MNKTKTLTTVALFSSLIIVLQFAATFIKFGSFPITLTLVPIIIAGCKYGPKMGALMGFVFGAIVSLIVVIGLDADGAVMFSIHPFITIMVCLTKGILAGLLSSLVYQVLKEKTPKLGLIIASGVAPIVNTLTLYIVLMLFFEASFAALVSALMSINFALELFINLMLAPSLMVLIKRKR